MQRVYLIGNGERPVDCKTLNGVTVGCNDLYKEFTPDYLVAVDSRMMGELDACNWKGQTVTSHHFTWRSDTISVKLPEKYGKFTAIFSGIVGLRFAISLFPTEIYLLGFERSYYQLEEEISNNPSIDFYHVTSRKPLSNTIHINWDEFKRGL